MNKDIIRQVASIIRSEHFPTGDRAALRKWKHGEPPLAYYRFAAEHIPRDLRKTRQADRTWLFFCHWMAVLALMNEGNRPLGEALVVSGLSERRLAQLLVAKDFVMALDRIVAWLKSKGQPVSFMELFYAVRYDGSDQTRDKIARDYFYYRDGESPEE